MKIKQLKWNKSNSECITPFGIISMWRDENGNYTAYAFLKLTKPTKSIDKAKAMCQRRFEKLIKKCIIKE